MQQQQPAPPTQPPQDQDQDLAELRPSLTNFSDDISQLVLLSTTSLESLSSLTSFLNIPEEEPQRVNNQGNQDHVVAAPEGKQNGEHYVLDNARQRPITRDEDDLAPPSVSSISTYIDGDDYMSDNPSTINRADSCVDSTFSESEKLQMSVEFVEMPSEDEGGNLDFTATEEYNCSSVHSGGRSINELLPVQDSNTSFLNRDATALELQQLRALVIAPANKYTGQAPPLDDVQGQVCGKRRLDQTRPGSSDDPDGSPAGGRSKMLKLNHHDQNEPTTVRLSNDVQHQVSAFSHPSDMFSAPENLTPPTAHVDAPMEKLTYEQWPLQHRVSQIPKSVKSQSQSSTGQDVYPSQAECNPSLQQTCCYPTFPPKPHCTTSKANATQTTGIKTFPKCAFMDQYQPDIKETDTNDNFLPPSFCESPNNIPELSNINYPNQLFKGSRSHVPFSRQPALAPQITAPPQTTAPPQATPSQEPWSQSQTLNICANNRLPGATTGCPSTAGQAHCSNASANNVQINGSSWTNMINTGTFATTLNQAHGVLQTQSSTSTLNVPVSSNVDQTPKEESVPTQPLTITEAIISTIQPSDLLSIFSEEFFNAITSTHYDQNVTDDICRPTDTKQQGVPIQNQRSSDPQANAFNTVNAELPHHSVPTCSKYLPPENTIDTAKTVEWLCRMITDDKGPEDTKFSHDLDPQRSLAEEPHRQPGQSPSYDIVLEPVFDPGPSPDLGQGHPSGIVMGSGQVSLVRVPVRQGLKSKILKKIQKEGRDPTQILKSSPKEPGQLTDVEKAKQARRRELNKVAASKSRKRNKEKLKLAEQELEEMIMVHQELQDEVNQREEEKGSIIDCLVSEGVPEASIHKLLEDLRNQSGRPLQCSTTITK